MTSVNKLQEAGKLEKIDLMDLDLFESGRTDAIFADLRKNAPVYWNQTENGDGFWALTKYADIASVLKDTGTFSSEYGNMLRVYGVKDPSAGKMMAVTDPPRHSFFRKLHNESFSPKVVAQMKSRVHSFICELLDQAVEGEAFDFFDEIAAKVPISVTCDLLGIPREDWDHVADLCVSSLSAEDPEFWKGNSIRDTIETVNTDLYDYLMELIFLRKQTPSQGVINMFIESGKMDDTEILMNSFSLLTGGIVSTGYALAGGMLALMEHPEEAERLYRDPSLISSAVEEIMRWTSPFAHVIRVAMEDVTIRGTPILAGQSLSLWIASGNRDEDVFEEAYRFNIARNPNPHLGFGTGKHYCLGSSLARMEINLLFSEIAARGYRFELMGPAVRVRSNFLHGAKHIPVCVCV